MVIKSKKQKKSQLPPSLKLRGTKKHKTRLTGGNGEYKCGAATLGIGGFGTVLACKADDKSDDKSDDKADIVAVKVANTGKSIPELKNEMAIYTILGNKNVHIVNHRIGANIIFEGAHPKPNHYLVLEYCNSGDLSKFVKETETYNITEILKQIFDGMTYLFETHILHLDLKPGNILVHKSETDTHTFKIADFGLSKHIPDTINLMPIKVDLTTMTAGTPIYKPTYSNIYRSTYFRDLYAFYCIMYYLYYRRNYNIMSKEKDKDKDKKIKKKSINTYETKEIVVITQNILTPSSNILTSISTILTVLQSNVIDQITKEFKDVKKKGTVITYRGKTNLNMSGVSRLNISGSDPNNNEPSFDKIKVDNDFYNSYYSNIKNLLAIAQPIKPLTPQKGKDIFVTSSLAGNTMFDGSEP